LNKLETMISVT